MATTTQPQPTTADPDSLTAARFSPGAWVRALRPKQWSKNVLVFAAPGAAGVLFHPTELVAALIAFVAFCLAASGTYLLNDAGDVAGDRLHPTKSRRPIAAGLIAPSSARAVGIVLLVAGITIGFATGRFELPATVLAYVLLTTSYSIWLKHVAVVDLAAVAAGFVLRAIGGAAATGVPISNWFFIVTSFAALFMVAGKRHAEFHETATLATASSPGPGGPTNDGGFRATLSEYSLAYLGYVRAVATGVTLVAYCLWAFEKGSHSHASVMFELSIVPFVIAVLRYGLVVDQEGGGAPEDVILEDRPLQVIGALWLAVMGLAVYFN